MRRDRASAVVSCNASGLRRSAEPHCVHGGRLTSSAPWGQAERTLADDVALDLVGPGVDGVAAGEQEQPLQRGQLVAGPGDDRLIAEQRLGAEHVHGQLAQVSVPRGPVELGDHGSGGTRGAALDPTGRAEVFQRMIGSGLRLRDPLPDDRVVDAAVAPSDRDDVVVLVAERHLLASVEAPPNASVPIAVSSSLTPPTTSLTPLARALSKKTSLYSLVPVTWRMGRMSSTLLAQRHEEVRDAPVLGLDVAVGLGQDEHPVAPVRERGPDLLAGDAPVVAVGLGPGLDVGEVGARVGSL